VLRQAPFIGRANPVLYLESIEGGHRTGATTVQRALTTALRYSYLWMMLG
jgi:prolyl oligopeptidase PreP (S9A serine peptidase family)